MGRTMRDFQRLEHLSSTAAFGLWADDVVMALTRVAAGQKDSADNDLLETAADMLDSAVERVEEPLSAHGSARSLAATDTTLTAAATVAEQGPSDSPEELLIRVAAAVREAIGGAVVDGTTLDPAVELFSIVGEFQLEESNIVLASREGAGEWTATQKILGSY